MQGRIFRVTTLIPVYKQALNLQITAAAGKTYSLYDLSFTTRV